MNAYLVGCNYWASHAGTEMWARWSEETVDRDFAELKKYGVRTLRVFPNWRDFQPIHLLRAGGGEPREYRMHGETPLKTPYDLDEACMEHFHTLCRLAEKHGLTLLVSIVTGWMSGRLFVPPMLEGKDILTDPECLMWESRFTRAFVREMKREKSIVAWDLGNECNCMQPVADPASGYLWVYTISSAIRLEDDTRPVISGMHAIRPDGGWTFAHQGELTDILTPHPYPSIFSNQDTEPLTELKTTLYPTAQVLYYAGLSGKPAMIEETGTFNDMLGNPDMAARYANTSLFSGWANGSHGMLWWCAHDQTQLDFPPYDWNMCENELGLLRGDYSPKPIAHAMARFTQMLESMPFDALPERQTDAVCVLTRGQNPLLINLAVTVLSKQSGLEARFVSGDDSVIPEAPVYLLPCLCGASPLPVTTLGELFRRVEEDGATIYISLDTGLMTAFETRTGLTPVSRQNRAGTVTMRYNGHALPLKGGKELTTSPAGCEVLARDEHGTILFSRHALGKGQVYLLSAPLESMIAETPGIVSSEDSAPYYEIYRAVGARVLAEKAARCDNPFIGLTLHPLGENDLIGVLMNYSGRDQDARLTLQKDWRLTPLFGDSSRPIPPNDALVIRLEKG